MCIEEGSARVEIRRSTLSFASFFYSIGALASGTGFRERQRSWMLPRRGHRSHLPETLNRGICKMLGVQHRSHLTEWLCISPLPYKFHV